jgi:hypothetical protein
MSEALHRASICPANDHGRAADQIAVRKARRMDSRYRSELGILLFQEAYAATIFFDPAQPARALLSNLFA